MRSFRLTIFELRETVSLVHDGQSMRPRLDCPERKDEGDGSVLRWEFA